MESQDRERVLTGCNFAVAQENTTEADERQKDQVLFSMLNLLLKIVREGNVLTSPKWAAQLDDIFGKIVKQGPIETRVLLPKRVRS